MSNDRPGPGPDADDSGIALQHHAQILYQALGFLGRILVDRHPEAQKIRAALDARQVFLRAILDDETGRLLYFMRVPGLPDAKPVLLDVIDMRADSPTFGLAIDDVSLLAGLGDLDAPRH